MIITMVTFQLPDTWDIEEAKKVFEATAPKYLGREGLIRKHYFLAEEGDRAGGIYLWHSRSYAEACYTPEWKTMVTDKYGAPPKIQYMVSPVTVDNMEEQIETS